LPPKLFGCQLIAAKSNFIFAGRPLPLKVTLFSVVTVENRLYFQLIIFGGQIPQKIGHDRPK
jgi:hypothetical protein